MTNIIQVDLISFFSLDFAIQWPTRRYKLSFNKCLSHNHFFINCRLRRSSSVIFPITLTNLKSHMRTTTCRSAQASVNCASTWTSSWPSSCLKHAVPLNATCNGTVIYPTSTSTFSDIDVKVTFLHSHLLLASAYPKPRARCMTVRPILPIVKKSVFAAAVFRRFMSDEFHRDWCKWNRFSELSPQRAFWCYVKNDNFSRIFRWFWRFCFKKENQTKPRYSSQNQEKLWKSTIFASFLVFFQAKRYFFDDLLMIS